MIHSFNVDIAKKYGVHSAIILENLNYWITKNEANEQHFYDGHYWTYNSKKAFSELFPYMTERQIDYALKKLIDDGIVITGKYNTNKCNQTLWYAITDFGYSILQNCEIDLTKLSNGTHKIVECNTNITTNNKQQIINNNNKKEEKTLNDIINEQVEDLRQPLVEFCKMRKANKKPLTTHAMELAINKLNELSKNTSEQVEIVNQSILNGWQAFYGLKGKQGKANFTEREYTKEQLDSISGRVPNIEDYEL